MFKYDIKNNMYWTSTKINKKSCVISFYRYKGDNDSESRVYTVGFGIGSNRKQVLGWLTSNKSFIEMKITGTGNLKPLIWAKNMLFEFEKFIISNNKNETIKIVVSGADNRRYKAYKSYLIKHGYEEEIYNMELYKLIK